MVADEQRLRDIARQSVQGRATDSDMYGLGDVVSSDFGLLWMTLGGLGETIPPYDFIYPNRRDIFLQQLARNESMMAAALYAMKSRAQTLTYKLNSDKQAAKDHAETILDEPFVGDSYQTLVSKTIDDFVGSNNGFFWERIAAGPKTAPIGDRPILGIGHMDSRQCWRTFDPEYPVIYTNPQDHTRHALHRDRVVFMADNVQPNELARGVGFCAVDRALAWVRIIRDSVIFRDEKISGKFNRAVGVAQGITLKQLRQALFDRDASDEAANLTIYNSIPFISAPVNAVGTSNPIKLELLDLASIPDGFVFKDDITLYAYILAFCFGVDAREFWPMTSSGATKADASIQHMKAQGKGFGLLLNTLEWAFRQCLPRDVTFEYDFTDDEQDKLSADLHRTKSDTYISGVNAGLLHPLEARALMIADGIYDGTVLESLQLPVGQTDTGQDDDEQDALDAPEQGDENPEATDQPEAETKKKVLRASRPAAQITIAAR